MYDFLYFDVIAFGKPYKIKMTPEESLMVLVDRACACACKHPLQYAHIGFEIVDKTGKQLPIRDGGPVRLLAGYKQPIYINERCGVTA